MSIDRLIVFAAFAMLQYVNRASKVLHINQPAVARQIKLLEKE